MTKYRRRDKIVRVDPYSAEDMIELKDRLPSAGDPSGDDDRIDYERMIEALAMLWKTKRGNKGE